VEEVEEGVANRLLWRALPEAGGAMVVAAPPVLGEAVAAGVLESQKRRKPDVFTSGVVLNLDPSLDPAKGRALRLNLAILPSSDTKPASMEIGLTTTANGNKVSEEAVSVDLTRDQFITLRSNPDKTKAAFQAALQASLAAGHIDHNTLVGQVLEQLGAPQPAAAVPPAPVHGSAAISVTDEGCTASVLVWENGAVRVRTANSADAEACEKLLLARGSEAGSPARAGGAAQTAPLSPGRPNAVKLPTAELFSRIDLLISGAGVPEEKRKPLRDAMAVMISRITLRNPVTGDAKFAFRGEAYMVPVDGKEEPLFHLQSLAPEDMEVQVPGRPEPLKLRKGEVFVWVYMDQDGNFYKTLEEFESSRIQAGAPAHAGGAVQTASVILPSAELAANINNMMAEANVPEDKREHLLGVITGEVDRITWRDPGDGTARFALEAGHRIITHKDGTKEPLFHLRSLAHKDQVVHIDYGPPRGVVTRRLAPEQVFEQVYVDEDGNLYETYEQFSAPRASRNGPRILH
jgi:hypothetical protein